VSFDFDDDDEDDEVTRARFDRLVELLDVVRANTKEINAIAEDIREDTRRRLEYVRLLRAYRAHRALDDQ
jgi:sugar/nucleoside kinase (ribokinase family)